MDPVKFARQLIDIESISGNEAAVGEFLLRGLVVMGFKVQKMEVAENRFNVYATPQMRGNETPQIVFSTHMDVVPPWTASSEDDNNIYGRGACDTKGIIAAMVAAAKKLLEHDPQFPLALLFVVGEERDSLGAKVANQNAPKPKPKALINGEPTESMVALASKGTLRVELVARGKMAHSAYPELGESAIDKLLTALELTRKLQLPTDPETGASTMNIGVIEGGRAPNVIPDYAKAQILIRLVGPSEELKRRIEAAVGNLCEVAYVLEIPFVKLRAFAGMPTFVAAFTTDIPYLSNWGDPVLFGPGSITVAHTDREFIAKKELMEAVETYVRMARELVA